MPRLSQAASHETCAQREKLMESDIQPDSDKAGQRQFPLRHVLGDEAQPDCVAHPVYRIIRGSTGEKVAKSFCVDWSEADKS